jgi:iron complex transport system ATP-binding protein
VTPPLLRLDDARVPLPGLDVGPFTLTAAAGERIAILGPSGAGKSTLLKLIAGERRPGSGAVRLLGRLLADWPPADAARRRAVLPQSHAVAFGLPAALVVGLGRVSREPDPGREAIVAEALRAARVGHLANRRFDTLSGGEQARGQLARVLAQLWDAEQGLLLVDEPLAALDPGLQFELMDALQTYVRERGHALLAVLHDLNQALAGFDRLWLLQRGRLAGDLRCGPGAIAPLERLYGIALQRVDAGNGTLAVIARRRRPAAAHAG